MIPVFKRIFRASNVDSRSFAMESISYREIWMFVKIHLSLSLSLILEDLRKSSIIDRNASSA